MPRCHCLIVGGGHNGLVAAILLARRGLRVVVLEAAEVVGGAVRTSQPFRRAPALRTSPGAYLLGVMPPELIARLGARFDLVRRDPHYFLPTLDRRSLLIGSDRADVRRQCVEYFSERDWDACVAIDAELEQMREDLAPSWLAEPLSAPETAERYVRPALRRRFLDLVHQPVEHYLRRFGFAHDLFVAMFAVTDGFSGLHAGPGHAGTGMNFLVHNMCRLPDADGTWMIVKGGMGAVATELARLAREAGAEIRTRARVTKILVHAGTATGVALEDGSGLDAAVVLSNADPFTMCDLAGADAFPRSFIARLDRWRRTGTTMKVNLALDRLPAFRCLPDDRGQYRTTIHLLPQEDDTLAAVGRAFDQAARGELPDVPTIEWYTHTVVDPTLRDPEGRHSAAFFVQWVPYALSNGRTWADERSRYAQHLVDLADRFAPGLAESVVDASILSPKDIEEQFGMRYGHIHHIDNTFGFDERMPYRTPIAGLYSCSAGCHPAGSVIGAAGHNAARCILDDMT
ncbi:MAG: NAD(P)/FAD-dependent oxidoreductase [Acidobacteria bacterium]|nr:NAD(P)/FAD-dependent oxidoreductase [Acidobacteriota bacterium]